MFLFSSDLSIVMRCIHFPMFVLSIPVTLMIGPSNIEHFSSVHASLQLSIFCVYAPYEFSLSCFIWKIYFSHCSTLFWFLHDWKNSVLFICIPPSVYFYIFKTFFFSLKIESNFQLIHEELKQITLNVN